MVCSSRRLRLSRIPLATLTGLAVMIPAAATASTSGTTTPGSMTSGMTVSGNTAARAVGAGFPSQRAADDGWTLASDSPAAVAAAPAYLGNGYVGTRLPADGTGFVSAPVATETHIAGVYADVPDLVHGGQQRQGSVNLPGWTQLDVTVAGQRFTAGAARAYRQVLDLRRGVVSTTATWSPQGRDTQLRYDVALDRSRMRVGLVRLQVTPRWSGNLTVTDVLGAGSELTQGGLRPVSVTADSTLAAVTVHTAGTGITVAEAADLRVPSGATVVGRARPAAMTATRTVTLPVRAGRSYEITKVAGFATSLDAPRPADAARRAATEAPTAARLLADNAAAWARLWASDIVLPNQPVLQRRVRAAKFYLLASVRRDVDWSISPVGLSAGGYNNHVFWDAETWMFPALLAQHPEEASSVVDYRYRTQDGAQRNAERTGYAGARHAWESALTGDEVTPEWAETGRLEQHITADVALAQWQYYLATGDREWLRTRGWPVISGSAEFWASRAERGENDAYHITGVEGPDEQNWPVDDSAYTNATAELTLRIAGRAARVAGRPANTTWARVAHGLSLTVPAPVPLDGLPAVRPEFRGYAGQRVKQADVVLLTYPWEYQRRKAVDRSNLAYYTPRYDPDGPAMTDSVNSIVAASLGDDCSAWTYTLRSVDPFVTAPFEQFTEARSGRGVFTFLTGEGGFLQEFLYGYPGMRWRPDRLLLDPALPPALSGGLRLTGLRWQGRVFDLTIGMRESTVTLRSGAAATVQTPKGTRTLSANTPLTLPTRILGGARASGPGAGRDNLTRCRPATADAADPSGPPDAAVDGSAVTAWTSGADPAVPSELTVSLPAGSRPTKATVTWQSVRPLAAYTVQVRTVNGWRTAATVPRSAGTVDRISFDPGALDGNTADSIRLQIPATREGGQNPRLAELSVTN